MGNSSNRMPKNAKKQLEDKSTGKATRSNVVNVRIKLINPFQDLQSMFASFSHITVFPPLRKSDNKKDNKITVCIRKKPLSQAEINNKEVDVISVPTNYEIVLNAVKYELDLTKYLQKKHFRFDYVFQETRQNKYIYKYTAKPLIKTIFEGGTVACIAYGQTGSGKTHTMAGCSEPVPEKGLYEMVAKDIFKIRKKHKSLKLVIYASFFEIYCDKVFDLLADSYDRIHIREDRQNKVEMVGLTERIVNSVDELLEHINQGNTIRTSANTETDYRSSRSHAVLQIILRRDGIKDIHGKYILVDLAAGDKGSDTPFDRYRTNFEGSFINKSLLSLKWCLRALGTTKTRIPFRDCKLAHVFKDILTEENSKVCLIAMVNPGMNSYQYSLDTLRFAHAIK
jgi:kinesin family protein 2/24